MDDVLAYLAAGLVAGWGVAHAIPTRQVVAGFGPTTTAVGGPDLDATVWLYRVAAGLLVAIAALTAFTGARTHVIWFKICPILLSTSAALLVIASLA